MEQNYVSVTYAYTRLHVHVCSITGVQTFEHVATVTVAECRIAECCSTSK